LRLSATRALEARCTLESLFSCPGIAWLGIAWLGIELLPSATCGQNRKARAGGMVAGQPVREGRPSVSETNPLVALWRRQPMGIRLWR
jgi:hypothetical protein